MSKKMNVIMLSILILLLVSVVAKSSTGITPHTRWWNLHPDGRSPASSSLRGPKRDL
jgi:hypothetical protein